MANGVATWPTKSAKLQRPGVVRLISTMPFLGDGRQHPLAQEEDYRDQGLVAFVSQQEIVMQLLEWEDVWAS